MEAFYKSSLRLKWLHKKLFWVKENEKSIYIWIYIELFSSCLISYLKWNVWLYIGFIQNFWGKIISKNNQTEYQFTFLFFIQLWCTKCMKNCSISTYVWFRTMCFTIYLKVNSFMSTHQTCFDVYKNILVQKIYFREIWKY